MAKVTKVITPKKEVKEKAARPKSVLSRGLIAVTIAAGFMLVIANSAL